MLKQDAEILLDIEKPAAGGRMIARHEGQVVLVSGAIPGERVRARIERAARSVVYATATEILEPNADRRPIASDPACGGNVYAHIEYPRQLTLKREVIADAFSRIGRIALPSTPAIAPSPEHGYRMRARLHVREGVIGFFREATHDLCDAAQTGQLLPETGRLLAVLGLKLRQLDRDAVTAIELAENRAGTERVLHFELRAGPSRRSAAFAPLAGITGVTGATARFSSGAAVTRLGGTPTVSDAVGELVEGASSGAASLRLTRHATAFFQGNRYLLPDLVRGTLAWLPAEGEILDLYAGVGLFSMGLAATGRGSITAVEGDRASGSDLRENARHASDAITVVVSSVEEYLRRRHAPAPPAALIDPPRTGLSAEAMEGLTALRPPRVVYVSCDVATLARDAGRLVGSGYQLRHLEAFDFFPNTAHVECLAIFECR